MNKKALVSAIVLTAVFGNTLAVSAAPLNGGADLDRYYGTSFGYLVEDTTDANDDDEAGDVVFVSSGMELALIGSSNKFDEIYFKISTAAESINMLTWYYSDGSDMTGVWQSFNMNSGSTSDLESTGVKTFAFTPPEGWAASTVESDETSYYYIAVSCDGCMGSSLAIDQISVSPIGGGGGGGNVPEFSTYMYILTLGVAGYFMYQYKQQNSLA